MIWRFTLLTAEICFLYAIKITGDVPIRYAGNDTSIMKINNTAIVSLIMVLQK